MIKRSPFKYFKTSTEIIRLAEKLYVQFPPSLRNAENLLHERVMTSVIEPFVCRDKGEGLYSPPKTRKGRIQGTHFSRRKRYH